MQAREEQIRAYQQLLQREMIQLSLAALRAKAPELLEKVCREAERRADAHVQEIFRIAEADRKAGADLPNVACRAGCSFCCFLNVVVTPFEALTIVSFIRRTFKPEEIVALQERLRDYRATRGRVAPSERVHFMKPCPLLSAEGFCTVYDSRPIACRTHHSLNVHACERSISAPGKLGVPRLLDIEPGVAPIWTGLQEGVKAAGLTGPRLDLPLAVEILLDDETAIARWMEGEPVFDIAEV